MAFYFFLKGKELGERLLLYPKGCGALKPWERKEEKKTSSEGKKKGDDEDVEVSIWVPIRSLKKYIGKKKRLGEVAY
jgi:hypothetical protein